MDRWLAGLKGTLNLWDAHRVKVYNKEFRAEHPEYFDPDGIMVFCGPQGSGKTLSMIQYAYRLSLAYPDMIICTNVELHDWPSVREIIQWEGMKSLSEVENGFAGVLFLIDEIQLEFNSLESKQIDPSVMQEIAQQRKQRKHIVGTSQVFQRIAKPFREQFKYVVQCRKVMGVLQCNTVIDSMLTLIQKLAHLCLKPLIALFDFPIVPAALTTLVNKLFEYIQAGTGILNFFVPFDVIRPAIDVFLAVWAVEHAYQLVLWVLRKVPILGIK